MKRAFFLIILLATVLVFARAEAASQDEWERVLAAARQEGTVTITGPSGTDARDVLTQPFTKKYGIAVEFLGGSGRVLSPRVLNERRARSYLWDIYVGGSSTALTNMIPAGTFDPLDPTFILPEVKNPKSWRGGAMEILAHDRLFIMSPCQRATMFVNPNMVKISELKSYKDLLNPKWKGKIVIDDPRKPGPGSSTFLFLYLHPQLGLDYIRKLARQDLVILKNYSQEVNFIAQGRYPILFGGWNVPAENLIKKGLPIAIVDPNQLREGSDLSAVTGALAIYNNAPHPNAAKVYINWILSKEGQTQFAKTLNYISARVDVPTDHALWRVPRTGAIRTYTVEAMAEQRKLSPELQKVFGK